jgi:hypothetical protein
MKEVGKDEMLRNRQKDMNLRYYQNALIPSPQIALGAMLWMVVWWVTECVSLGFTSLLAPFIFITSGYCRSMKHSQNLLTR